jgi:hypothetical protein
MPVRSPGLAGRARPRCAGAAVQCDRNRDRIHRKEHHESLGREADFGAKAMCSVFVDHPSGEGVAARGLRRSGLVAR